MIENEIEFLQKQLATARSEISKMRQKVRNLTYIHNKDIAHLTKLLQDFRCEGCRKNQENSQSNNSKASKGGKDETEKLTKTTLQYIGVIRSSFPEKRGVPRQSSIGLRLKAKLELNSEIFTNPEHSLEGLNEYSHLWIIYHFNKNEMHPKAKVSPPRLNGKRVGVFSTRSPHRPSPIGLSLVEIENIKDSVITFCGTDMIDGTPVLDIKPYIPIYDAPHLIESDIHNCLQELDEEKSDKEPKDVISLINHQTLKTFKLPTAVKIPNWVKSDPRMSVNFNDTAELQLQELKVNRQSIADILEADPRSVYLRTKYDSQIFTFQLEEVTVTCKFDDEASTVTVVQVRKSDHVEDEK